MKKKYNQARKYKVIVIYHRKEIPDKEKYNCMRFYLMKAKKDKCIMSLKNFFGLKNFEINPEMVLKEVYIKHMEKLDKLEKNFS
jgi:hypothetical protein